MMRSPILMLLSITMLLPSNYFSKGWSSSVSLCTAVMIERRYAELASLSVTDVGDLLVAISLENYKPAFEAASIDGERLSKVTESSQLESAGIPMPAEDFGRFATKLAVYRRNGVPLSILNEGQERTKKEELQKRDEFTIKDGGSATNGDAHSGEAYHELIKSIKKNDIERVRAILDSNKIDVNSQDAVSGL
jgi:hypothetical protein